MKFHLSNVLLLGFISLKMKWLLSAFLANEDSIECLKTFSVNYSDFLSDPNNIEFPLMDKPSIHFKLQPLSYNFSMIVLVLSAPQNIKQRNKLRKEIELINNGKLLFFYS